MFLSSAYLPHVGGIEVLLQQVCRELRCRGHEVEIVTADGDADQVIDDVRVHRLSLGEAMVSRNVRDLHRHRRRLAEIYTSFDPDVVHSHDVGSLLWLHQQTTRSHHLPTVVTAHTVLARHIGQGSGVLEAIGAMLARADAVTAVSKVVADDLCRFAPQLHGRVGVVPNGVAPPGACTFERDPMLLVAVGRLEPPKMFGVAIEAMRQVTARYPDARLVIAGDGSERPVLEQQVVELGLSPSVELLGRVDPIRVRELMSGAAMVLMPTRYEGFPLVALEAAWSATPVVGSAVPGLDEAVQHDVTGLLVQGTEAAPFADAILSLMDDPARARQLGLAAKSNAEQRFGLGQCVDAFDEIYRRAISRRESCGGLPK